MQANAILCVVGIGLVVTGIGLLFSTSKRTENIDHFNVAADAWEGGIRSRFGQTTFKLLFLHCPTCDPEIVVEFHSDDSGRHTPPRVCSAACVYWVCLCVLARAVLPPLPRTRPA